MIAGNPARIISTVNSVRERKAENAFNFRGMSASEKREEILRNPEKYIVK